MLLGILFVLFSQGAMAAPASQTIPYYGDQFYRDLSSGVGNDDLKESLGTVLRSYHLKTKGLDQIVESCDGDSCYAHVVLGYDRARIFMMGVYHLIDHGNGEYGIYDVYCDKEKVKSDFRNGYAPAPRQIPDANILNTEHTWPQSRFTGRYPKEMQKSDLHHLYPTDNELNSIRGNNPFGEVTRDSRKLKCPASRTGQGAGSARGEVFEPPRNHRGNVARALFYFSVRYQIPIDEAQEQTLRKWNREDPVDQDEINRNDAVQKVQGNRNPFVDYPELSDRIRDF